MLTTNLQNYIEAIENDTNTVRALMIDGPWGCGKTYAITKYIIDNKKNNVIYISLFGLRNVNEVVVKLFEYLDSSFIRNIDGHYSIKDVSFIEEYNGTLIVFDDLERVESELSFISIFGIVESLKKLGFKVICICSSDKVDDNNKDEFYRTVEKTFDLKISVFGNYKNSEEILGIEIDKTFYETFDENWRLLLKSKLFFESLKKDDKAFGIINIINNQSLPELVLFKCVCYATKCIFSSDFVLKEPINDFQKIEYHELLDNYGITVANEFNNIFSRNKDDSFLKTMVLDIIDYILTGDPVAYVQKKQSSNRNNLIFDENPIFKKQFFLLSDEDREKYKLEFIDNIEKFDFKERASEQILRSFLIEYSSNLNHIESNKIINQIIKTVGTKEHDLNYIFIPLNDGDVEGANQFRKALLAKAKEKEVSCVLDDIDLFANERDYQSLLKLLEKINSLDNYVKTEAIKRFLKYSFVIPDLSQTIDFDCWRYCHEIARLVKDTEFENSFINVLEKQCENSDSKSLNDKCNALIKYGLEK